MSRNTESVSILICLSFPYTVKPVLNGISRDQKFFLLKPGFRLIKVYYNQYNIISQGTWKYFRLTKGPFKAGFTVFELCHIFKDLVSIFMLWFCPAFGWQDINIYLVFFLFALD
jgi:hypothetical protein